MATWQELPKPPKPKGVEEVYRKDLWNYLYNLVQQLEALLNAAAAEKEGGAEQ